MGVRVVVTSNQIAPRITGWKSQQSFYVDDAYTNGLEYGKVIGVASGTSLGVADATLHYAGHVGGSYTDIADAPIAVPAIKATGVILDASALDQYGRSDNQDNETRLYPAGAREYKKIGCIPEWVWHIVDEANSVDTLDYFRKVDETILVGTVVSFDDTTATIVLTGDYSTIRLEEKLEIDGANYWVVSNTYDSVGDKTTIELNEGAGDVNLEIIVKGQLFDDVYLADDMTGLPFTMIPSTGRQKIGTVEATYAIRCRLR